MSIVIYFERYGAPGVLKIRKESPSPPGPHQVRIVNHAISVNPADWMVVASQFSNYLSLAEHPVPGVESAGVTTAIGSGIRRFAVGDHVIRQGQSNA